MALSYSVRLICESLSVFLLVQVVLAFAAGWIASAAIRRSDRLAPHRAAALLLGLRMAPCSGALLGVVALCVPSYLWLEPAADLEKVGPAALLMVGLAAMIWLLALARGAGALLKSARFARDCCRIRCVTTLGGLRATVVESPYPLLALIGLWRPRIVVFSAVLKALSPEQLEAVARHERAHWNSRDNLNRLAVVATPVLPLFRGVFQELERSWTRVAEWAADGAGSCGARGWAVERGSSCGAPGTQPSLGDGRDFHGSRERRSFGREGSWFRAG